MFLLLMNEDGDEVTYYATVAVARARTAVNLEESIVSNFGNRDCCCCCDCSIVLAVDVDTWRRWAEIT